MAKRPPKPVPASSGAPFHSPFAALDALRGALPVADPAAAVSAEGAPVLGNAGDGNSAKPAKLGKLVLQREKKGRGGKTVTRVRGLPPAELTRWAGDLKRALGCGATVEDDEVVLLGDLVGRAADWLEAQGAARVVRGN